MRETIAAIMVAVIGLAVVAVLVSKNANTPAVFASAGLSLGSLIQSAVSPVTGNYGSANTSGTSATTMLGNLLGGTSGNFLNV